MGMIIHERTKGLAILLSVCISSAVAYQQEKPAAVVGPHTTNAEAASIAPEKSRMMAADKPAKCYLALHLEMAGAPFAARGAVDTMAGVAHACDVELQNKGDRNANLN